MQPTNGSTATQFTDVPPATWSDHLRTVPQYLLPQRLISSLVYRLARTRIPWLKDVMIRAFIRYFEVDMAEAADPNPQMYPDFNHFFTRALRQGSRPIANGASVVSCPVDGFVSQCGEIADDTLFQAKGRSFTLQTLLADDKGEFNGFRDGGFATLYLSPRDYHRIHMPLGGTLTQMIHVPGRLFSVSPVTTRVIPGLFARNERVAAIFDTEVGPMALILVGAINVSSIETVWAGAITPPWGTSIQRWRYPVDCPDAIGLDKGAEVGRFNMGSTVIVLFSKGAVRWNRDIVADAAVRMGQPLAESRNNFE